MKFLFADSLDVIDPNYDFLADRSHPSRKPLWDDHFPHEFFPSAPYDGVLISRGIVDGHYSDAQAMRFRRDGARKFIRFNKPEHISKMMMGDCGAFSYVKLEKPPYSAENMVEFYGDGGFTHGCSVDHIIFEYFSDNRPECDVSEEVKKRYEITLNNAEEFLNASRTIKDFVPLGAVQGWSPQSMADAAIKLEKIGYKYIAIGGLVPLSAPQIHEVLSAIKNKVSPSLKIHLLGFAKAEQIHEFIKYNITSFDSTSPFIRAFKDAKANYYSNKPGGGLDYYSAIKIPQATTNPGLMRAAKRGDLNQETLTIVEQKALNAIRDYDAEKLSFDDACYALAEYTKLTLWDKKESDEKNEAEITKYLERAFKSLYEKPWKKCDCQVCQTASVETIIFRASNRNKRRGFHNLWVYYNHLQKTLGSA